MNSSHIKLADCYLWDAWSFIEPGKWHLYCLGLHKYDSTGILINPDHRNDHQFHIHHFESSDNGQHWADCGVFQQAGVCANGADSGNVWSGDSHRTAGGDYWFAATGIRAIDSERPFVQSLMLGKSSTPQSFDGVMTPVLMADEHHDQLTDKGYFLAGQQVLGHRDGELGGSILALRDPYIVDLRGSGDEKIVDVVFAAKADNGTPAMGHIRVSLAGDVPELVEICHPIALPDAALFTQFEVPKVIFDAKAQRYLLLGSTADRVDESQPEEEVNRYLRLYYANDLRGPWNPATLEGSELLGAGCRFGATILEYNSDAQQLVCLAPLTTMDESGGLFFDYSFSIDVGKLGRKERLAIQILS